MGEKRMKMTEKRVRKKMRKTDVHGEIDVLGVPERNVIENWTEVSWLRIF